MNKDSMQEYIFAAQRGDRQALVELLTYSWGIVSYQCKKLLPSRQSAEKMTTVVLKTVAEKLPSLTDPAKFYGWVGHLTAVRCMRVRATLLENGQGDAPETERNFSFASMELNKAETAQVAVMLADMLEDRQRLNLYLYSLSGLGPKAISQLTGQTEQAIQADIQDAQLAIQKQMKLYAAQGVQFTQADSLPALLRTDMLLNQDPERADQVVYEILPGLTLPRPPKQPAAKPAQPRSQQSRPGPAAAQGRPTAPQTRPAAPRAQPAAAPRQGRAKNQDVGLIKALALIAALLALILIISVVILVVRTRAADGSAAVWNTARRTMQAWAATYLL